MAKIAASLKTGSQARSLSPNGSRGGYNEQQEIEKLAYQFFEERGFEHGHDREDWLRAEAIIRSRKN